MARKRRTLLELHTVILNNSIKVRSGCIEWQGAKNARGYGVISFNARAVGVHRVMLAHSVGDESLLDKIDRSKSAFTPQYVLHSCDNPICCNPKHLRLGTATDNSAEMVARQRNHKFNAKLPRKLTPEAVREIRREAVTWDGLCDMMKKHKVGQATINEVMQRRTYKHVE